MKVNSTKVVVFAVIFVIFAVVAGSLFYSRHQEQQRIQLKEHTDYIFHHVSYSFKFYLRSNMDLDRVLIDVFDDPYKYTGVTFKNEVYDHTDNWEDSMEGEIFLYPSEKTYDTIERFNQYIVAEDAGLGIYDENNPVTIEDIFNEYDTINEIIDGMSNAQSSVVFVF